MTYQEVYLMDNLTIEAKAIYGMLCSFAGSGAKAYPSVSFICDKLQISENRFYKHMNLLVGAGVVEKKAVKSERGIYKSNIYTLVPNIQFPCMENEGMENEGMENEGMENEGMENEGTNNNIINNNTINNRTGNSSIYCSEPEETSAQSRTTGLLIPLVDGSFYDVPEADVEQWKKAYPAVNIEQEINKMIAWCNSNPTRRKTRKGVGRFINGWLTKEQDRGRWAPKEPEPEDPNEEYRQWNNEYLEHIGGKNGSGSGETDRVDDADLPFQ